MTKDFLGREIYKPDEIKGLELPNTEPNDCGVLCNHISVEAYRKKNDYINVEIARYRGRYYRGVSMMIGDCGSGGWPTIEREIEGKLYEPPTYGTAEEAFNAELDDLEGIKRCKDIVAKIGRLPVPQKEAKVHNCIDCPLAYFTDGKRWYKRDCTVEICDTMMHKPTREDIEFFKAFYTERMSIGPDPSKEIINEWIKNTKNN